LLKEKLNHNLLGAFFDRTYDIPVDLVQGQTDAFGQPVEHVTLRFRSTSQDIAGGIFGICLE